MVVFLTNEAAIMRTEKKKSLKKKARKITPLQHKAKQNQIIKE